MNMRHASFQFHRFCCLSQWTWLLFTLHTTRLFLWWLLLVTPWSNESVLTVTLPSNRDCACLRLSLFSRWDLTRRGLTSLPYWLIAGCHAWDAIHFYPQGGIDSKVERRRQGPVPQLPAQPSVCVMETHQGADDGETQNGTFYQFKILYYQMLAKPIISEC